MLVHVASVGLQRQARRHTARLHAVTQDVERRTQAASSLLMTLSTTAATGQAEPKQPWSARALTVCIQSGTGTR